MSAQNAADVYWIIATHQDNRIAGYNTAVYRAAEKDLIAAIREEYPVTLGFARKVASLVVDYGPDDTLSGTEPRRGIESYVRYVQIHKGRI